MPQDPRPFTLAEFDRTYGQDPKPFTLAEFDSLYGVSPTTLPERTAMEVPEYLRQPEPTEPIEGVSFPGLEPDRRAVSPVSGWMAQFAGQPDYTRPSYVEDIKKSTRIGIQRMPQAFGAITGAVARSMQTQAKRPEGMSVQDYLTSTQRARGQQGTLPPEQQIGESNAILSYLKEKGGDIAQAATERIEAIPMDSPENVAQWVAQTLPMGFLSTIPSMIGAAVGTAVAGLPGGVAGAMGPAYALNWHEAYQTLQESGEGYEGLNEDDAAGIAALVAGPMAGLDAFMPTRLAGKWLGPIRRNVQKWLVARVAAEIGKNAPIEGITEGLQNVVRQLATKAATGRPFDVMESLEDVAAGALVGGAVGGASGLYTETRGRGRPATTTEPRVETEQEASIRRGMENPMTLVELEERLAAQEASVTPSEPLPFPEPSPVVERVPETARTAVPEPVGRELTPEEVRLRNVGERDPLTGELTLDPMDRPTFERRSGEQGPPEGIPERRAVEPVTPEVAEEPTVVPEGTVGIVRLPVSKISTDPVRFQFKQLGAEGLSAELRGVQRWNEQMSGVISVWQDPADGKTYVVNGHHRLDLAQRLGVEDVNVQYIDAANAEEARATGAILNIAEGRGTPVDVAKYMRDMGATAADLSDQGVSLTGDLARKGTALSHLAPDVFDEVAVGKIQQTWGVAIGEILEDPALQRQALAAVRGKRLSGPEVREVARQVGVAGTEDVTQETLFGTETEVRSLFVERAQIATAVKRRLAKDRRLFGFVSKEGRAEELGRAGETIIDVKAAQRMAESSAMAEEIFERLYTRSGPVADLVSEGARRLKHGERTTAVLSDIYTGIGDAVQQEIQSLGGTPEATEGPSAVGVAPTGGLESGAGRPREIEPEGPGFFTEPAPPIPGALPPTGPAAEPVTTKRPRRKKAKEDLRTVKKGEQQVGNWVLPKKRNTAIRDSEALSGYFTPGQIVESYGGGRDLVVSYGGIESPGTPSGWQFNAVVQAVDNDGNPIAGEGERQHSTPPTRTEFERAMRDRGAWPGEPEVAPVEPKEAQQSPVVTPENLDRAPLAELVRERDAIKQQLRAGVDFDEAVSIADELDMLNTEIANRTGEALDPEADLLQDDLFSGGRIVATDEQASLFGEEARAVPEKGAFEKPLSPKDIARLKREGAEPEGESPLALFDEPMREGTGPFEVQAATIETPDGQQTLSPVNPVELTRLVVQLLGGEKIFVKRYPQARGAFYPDPADPRIGLNPELGRDYDQFVKTLSHEAGHLTDFLPDLTMKRGNILGRIGTLQGYMAETIDKEPTDPSEALTPKDRRKIRSLAEKEVGAKPAKDNEVDLAAWQQEVSERYRERILDEMDTRNLMGRQAIHEELLMLSEWWRPYGPKAASLSYKTYRNSSKELYADAVSVLLTSPGSLQERAPTFFDAFLAYMEKKPDVQAAYDGIQELLGSGEEQIYAARKAEREANDERQQQIERESESKKNPQTFYAHLRQSFLSRADPAIRAEGERVGDVLPSSEDRVVKMVLQEYRHADNANRLMLTDISERVHEPMLAAGITPTNAAMYLENMRVAEGDRGGMAEHAREEILRITGTGTWAEAEAAYAEGLAEEGSEYDPGLLALANSGVLNPGGNTPEEARRTLAGIKNEFGEEKYAQLEGFMKEYRQILFATMQEGVRVGSISQDLFSGTIEPNKDTYVPFAVLEYYNGRMTAAVKQQIGTVKSIGNTYDMAMMKAMAMNRLNERQKAVTAVVDVLDIDFPGAASEERVIDRHHREQKPGAGKRNLVYLRDGKMYYREVDEYVALMLESSDLGRIQRIASAVGSKTYGFFHPLYVTWSLAWQLRNIQRDTKRTYKDLAAAHPGTTYRQAVNTLLDIPRLAKAYKQTFKTAWGHAQRRSNAQIREMLKDRALGRAFHSFEVNEQDMTHERLLTRYGLREPEGHGVKNALQKIGSPVEKLGIMQETWSKAAAYKMLGEMGITGKQRAYMVRNYSGTPDSTERGLASDVSNSLFLYSNVIMAGWRADMEVGLNPKTAAGYWMRSVMVDFAPKAMMAAAALGLWGDDLKEWYERIPSYDKEKYLIVPIPPFWSTNDKGDKKAVYMRVPHDDVNRVVAAATWALLMSADPMSVGRATGIVAGEFPGVNPALSMGIDVGQLIGDRNPYDEFRGRDIIPRTQWDAGGWHRWKEMGRHALRQFGIASQIAGRWLYDSPEEGESTPGEEALRSVPGLSSLIKITDRGLNENNYWELDWERRNRARLRLDLSQSVRRATSERSTLNNLGIERLNERKTARRNQLNIWYTQSYKGLTAEMERARDAKEDVAYKAARDRLNESVARIGDLVRRGQGGRRRPTRRTRRR